MSCSIASALFPKPSELRIHFSTLSLGQSFLGNRVMHNKRYMKSICRHQLGELTVNLVQRGRHFILTAIMVLLLTTTAACGGSASQSSRTTLPPAATNTAAYGQYQRGNSSAEQNFGDWVVRTSKGLVKDAYVRDNNKLGVVISPQVQPNEVRPLARSLAQGFRKNFPDRDLTVLMYAPDKKLILTAKYDQQSGQIQYQ